MEWRQAESWNSSRSKILVTHCHSKQKSKIDGTEKIHRQIAIKNEVIWFRTKTAFIKWIVTGPFHIPKIDSLSHHPDSYTGGIRSNDGTKNCIKMTSPRNHLMQQWNMHENAHLRFLVSHKVDDFTLSGQVWSDRYRIPVVVSHKAVAEVSKIGNYRSTDSFSSDSFPSLPLPTSAVSSIYIGSLTCKLRKFAVLGKSWEEYQPAEDLQ